MKPRQTHEKRRKELARQERQKDKAERRAQRKAQRLLPDQEGDGEIDPEDADQEGDGETDHEGASETNHPSGVVISQEQAAYG